MYVISSTQDYVSYNDGHRIQMNSYHHVLDGRIDGILHLVEHTPVYTIGTSGGEDNILCPRDQLKKMGIDVVHVNRGGNITYHGPGQLVAYPIFNLSKLTRDVHWFVDSLEQVVINLLGTYGVISSRKKAYRGVWVGDKKICALGVHVSKWITTHGLALNYKVNQNYYNLINPCGITEFGIASLDDFIGDVNPKELRSRMIQSFENVFDIHFEIMPE